MKPIGIQHFAEFQFINTLRAGTPGKLSFATKRANMPENCYDNDLWFSRNGSTQRLTWSGDVKAHWWKGDEIVFSALRDKKDKERAEKGLPRTVLYTLHTDKPGEAAEWLRLDYDISDFVTLPDGRFLFTATYDPDLDAILQRAPDESAAIEALAEEKDYEVLTALPFWSNGDGFTVRTRSRLYMYNAGQITPLTDELTDVSMLRLSPSGEYAFYIAASFETKAPLDDHLMRISLQTLTIEDISPESYFRHDNYAALDDENLVVFGSSMADYGVNENGTFYHVCAAPYIARALYSDMQHCGHSSVGSDLKMPAAPRWAAKDGIVYWINTLSDSSHLMSINADTGEIRQLTSLPGAVLELAIQGEDVYISAMRGHAAAEIYMLSAHGEEQQLTAINTAIASEYAYASPEPVSFINSEDVEIEGWVLRPTDWQEGDIYPTILNIHGGPKTVYGTVAFHEMQYWANCGFGVMFCNPTGGDGRGAEFADIRGRYGLIDYEDLMAFVDTALVQHSWIDPARLGVTGGSYGGYMTNWIIGHTGRFKAAASQRSISNWISMMNTTDIGYFFAPDQTAADPWSDINALWEQSPLKYANRVSTPTLFIHSEEDYRCWMAEGMQMYTALQIHGVETRLCLFRGENHELSRSGKPKHRVRRLREITSWFEKHLKDDKLGQALCDI